MDQAFATMDTALHTAGYRTRLEDGGEDTLVRTAGHLGQPAIAITDQASANEAVRSLLEGFQPGTHRVALRWYEGDQPVFARMVHVSGIEADGFMGRGVQKCERVIEREVEVGVESAQRILDS